MRLAASTAMAAIALCLAACGQSETTTVSVPGGTVSTDATGSSLTVKGANGEVLQIGGGGDAAAQLPDTLPLFPGAKVTASVTGNNGTQKTISITFETSSAPGEVIAFYKDKAAALGLPETLSAADANSTTFMATKDQTMVMVVASKGESSTEAQLTWAAPPG